MLPKREKGMAHALRKFTPEERFGLTTKKAYAERGTLIKDYTYWYLTQNEYPYEDRNNQMILWSKSKEENEVIEHHAIWKEFGEILADYVNSGFSITMNARENQSVPSRLHFHIYKIAVAMHQ